MRSRIVCLGNEIVSDDAIGIRVGRVLQRLVLPDGVDLSVQPALGLDLLDVLVDHDRVLIVDAVRTGGPPGTLVSLDLTDAASLAQCPACSHSFGVAEVLEVARRMGIEARSVSVVGVEARVLDRFGTALSPEVQAALPALVDAALSWGGASEDTRRAGAEIARELSLWQPTASEL